MALTPEQKQLAAEKKAKAESAKEDILMREVDEAYRKDQLFDFWGNYGKALIAGIVLLLVALLGWWWWDSTQEADLEASSEQLVGAIDQVEAGNLDTANTTLAELAAADGSGKAPATMLQAGIAQQQNRPGDAAKLFQQVADDADAPQPLRDLALIRAMSATFDTRKPAEIIAALKPLAVPGNAWFGSAGELVAMAYLEQGKTKEAGTLLSAISKDKGVPESIRSRTRQVAGLLGVDAIEDVEALLEAEGVTGSVEAPVGSAPAPATAQ